MVRAHSRKLCVPAELNEEGYVFQFVFDIVCTARDCSALLMGTISQSSHILIFKTIRRTCTFQLSTFLKYEELHACCSINTEKALAQ